MNFKKDKEASKKDKDVKRESKESRRNRRQQLAEEDSQPPAMKAVCGSLFLSFCLMTFLYQLLV